MKLTAKFIAALLVLGSLSALAIVDSAKVFVRDILELHGNSISGVPVTVQDITADWPTRTLDLARFEAGKKNTPDALPLLQIATIHTQWPKEIAPDFSRDSLLPDILSLDELVMTNISIVYDADSEGGNLIPLRKSIADAANTYLRQRLNASGNGSTTMPQRFLFHRIQLQNIEVDAKSRLDASRQKKITIRDITLSDIGVKEGGISMPEMLDTLSETLSESIHREALAQGIIDPPEITPITSPQTAKKRSGSSRKSDGNSENSSEDSATDNKAKQTARNVGEGFKKIGRGLKKLFTSDN